jgi:ABC-type maltose transport system permease subunit
MTVVNTEVPHRSVPDDLLRDYHDARRREDQWRIPQLLLALATPILALISVIFIMGGTDDFALISGALAIITGVGAALLAVEVWRSHRTAVSLVNRFRTEYPADAALLMKDPI